MIYLKLNMQVSLVRNATPAQIDRGQRAAIQRRTFFKVAVYENIA